MKIRYKTLFFGMVLFINIFFICSLVTAGGGVKRVKITNANANKKSSDPIKPNDPFRVSLKLIKTRNMNLIIKIFNPENVLWKIKKEKLTDKIISYSCAFLPPGTGFIQG
ncbi:MAG: hypothetical protein U9N73_07705, partial [Candidatus Auribacterota bacterium]|nr:hypothetical protein [Candidatus Auribacterota bacterium]